MREQKTKKTYPAGMVRLCGRSHITGVGSLFGYEKRTGAHP